MNSFSSVSCKLSRDEPKLLERTVPPTGALQMESVGQLTTGRYLLAKYEGVNAVDSDRMVEEVVSGKDLPTHTQRGKAESQITKVLELFSSA